MLLCPLPSQKPIMGIYHDFDGPFPPLPVRWGSQKQARRWPFLLNKPSLLLPALFSSKTGSFFTTLLEKNEGVSAARWRLVRVIHFGVCQARKKHSHHHHFEAALVRPQGWKWLKALTALRHVEGWSELLLIIEIEKLLVWLRPSRYDNLHLRRKTSCTFSFPILMQQQWTSCWVWLVQANTILGI